MKRSEIVHQPVKEENDEGLEVTPQGNKYNDMVEAAVTIVQQFQRKCVEFYVLLGRAGLEVQVEYGKGAIKSFAVELSRRTGTDIKDSNLYYAMRLCENLTPEQIEKVKTLGLAWRNVQPLIKNSLSSDQRDKILNDIETGAIDKGEVRESVKEITGDKELSPKTRKEGTRKNEEDSAFNKAWKQYTKIPEVLMMISASIRGAGLAPETVFRGGDLDMMIEAKETLTRIESTADDLNVCLGREFEKAKRYMEEVKSAMAQHAKKIQKK